MDYSFYFLILNGEKQFEKLHPTFEQSWDILTSWRLFNIIVIICALHFETLFYIFQIYRTVMHFLTFGGSEIITMILNNLQLVNMSQLC